VITPYDRPVISPSRRLRWPARPVPAPSARLRLGQTTSHSFRWQATTPTPAIPACGCLPHRRGPRPHFGRTQRTRTRTDTGRRTLDTWTLGRPHRTLDTGGVDRHVWTLDPRTEHWTPDAGRGRGQGDDVMTGIRAVLSHHAERSRAGTRLSTPKRVHMDGARSTREPCRLGSEVTCRRETGSRNTRQRSVAPPAKVRLGALLSSLKNTVLSVARWGKVSEELARLAVR
jgi:hypothetical protein